MADDVSFPHMGAYGTTWVSTPAFDSIASAGILFTNAYTPNAKCAPSRASFLTGRNSWQLEEAANHAGYFPEKFITFMEVLSQNGYHTGFVHKGWAPGKLRGDKSRLLTGKAYDDKKLTPPTTGISNIDYVANFEKFLNDKSGENPFCFWYGAAEPHRQYEYGSGIKSGTKKIEQIDQVPSYWPSNDTVKTDMLDYAFELEYFDKQIFKMLALLKARNELDNTIVIVTADNGMPFPRAKGQSYEISNHLPLAIMWGSALKMPGRKVSDFISFIDIAPTLLDVVGIDQSKSGMQPIEGKSFINVIKGQPLKNARDYVLIGKERHDIGRPNDEGYPMRGIRRGNYLYIKNYEPDRWPAGNPETGYLNVDGGATKTTILNERRKNGKSPYWDLSFGKRVAEELYDVVNDADCINNLALQPEFQKIKDELRTAMEVELKKQNDPRMLGKGYVFDEYPHANESNKDFYNRFMKGEKVKAVWVNPTDFEKEY